ncbi:discoidin domain-containing protein [Aerococcaceae bacterium NML210727]|nr:discoidin domain-containing protein [Aerococcaceae bacterium NML210727]MCW6654305.1 discoidin domain-containing protein [Aerococcaceae bacterium NML201296]
MKREKRTFKLKHCLLTSLSISSILLFASQHHVFAEGESSNENVSASEAVNEVAQTSNEVSGNNGEQPEEINASPATDSEGEVSASEVSNANEAETFARTSYHLGAVTNVTQDENIINIDYATGQKGRLYFYDDHVVRYYVDKTGEFAEKPAPSRADRPADIVVKQLVDYDKILPTLTQTETTARIATSALYLDLDKVKSTIKITNRQTNKVVLEELAPLEMTQSNTKQTLKAGENTQYFGGGTQNGRFTHKGESINIVNENNWVDGGVASPNPFYWTTDGYGVLRHTFKPGRYDFEKTKSNQVVTTHNEERFDAFYFVNDKPVDLLKDYYKLTGSPAVLPIFSLYQGHLNAYNRDYWVEVPQGTRGAVFFEEKGKWYKEFQPNQLGDRQGIRESLNGEKTDENYPFTARAVIDRYKKHDMPLGWMLTNDGYGAGYGQTGTLAGNIENLRRFSEYAREHGVESGLWTQSDLHPKEGVEPLLQRDLPNEVERGLVRILKTDVAWVGPGYSFGLNGIEDAAKIMKEKGNNARPFIITLDGWGGTQRHGGIWTGDQTGGEWEYIRFHIPTYIGTGLSGNPNVSSDMDGIFGGGNKIINVRDFQWKTFTTMMLNMDGWGYNPKTPFAFDATTTDLNRSYLKLKSMLVPYSYSISHEAADGNPIVQAMFLEFPDDAVNYTKEVQYQFMYGKNFLVAPVYENVQADAQGNDVRNGIYLPKGTTWIDFFTGEIYDGGQVLNNFAVPIWKQPVFVRNGAIIPMTKAHNNYKEINHALRQVSFYPHGKTDFTLVEDDGVSEAYREGKVAKTYITSVLEGDKATLTINRTDNKYDAFVKEKVTQFNVNVSKRPTGVRLLVNDNQVSDLREVFTLADFEAGTNVFFYDATPNINQFSTEQGAFHNVPIIKNPVLRVKSAVLDVTQNAVKLEVLGFEMNNRKNPVITTVEGAAPEVSVVEAERTPTQIKLAWQAVEGATSYEVLVDGIRHTNITAPEFVNRDLKFNSAHKYQVRAVVGDKYTEWSDVVQATTKENPLIWAVDNIKVSSKTPAQGGTPLHNLVDKQFNSEYHSKWDKVAIPEDLVFDLGLSYDLDKIEYHPRSAGTNGIIRRGKIYVSDDYKHWKELSTPIAWAGNNAVKQLALPKDTRGRYVWMHITDTAGGNRFVSGNEMLIFRKEGDTGRVVGDVSGNRAIDENDVTSFTNYAGLRRGIDNDFEGYVEVADLNNNGVIDAYDIYYVTRQLGDGEAKPSKPGAGNLAWVANKENVRAGEEVEFTLRGSQLANVEAIHASFQIDKTLYEVVADSLTIDPTLNTMDNFSRVRTHGDTTQEVFVILTNRKDRPTIAGDKRIATIRLRALRDHAPNVENAVLNLIGSDLNIVESQTTNAPTLVPKERITVTGNDVYQPGHGPDKLIDGNLESVAELLWDYAPNHVNGQLPAHVTLPQDITFNLGGDEPTRLQSIKLHKRTPGNGTVTKYRVTTYLNDAQVHQSEDIVVPFADALSTYVFETPQDVTRVVLTVLEAKTGASTVNNRMMTLKEVQFYEVPRTDEGQTGEEMTPVDRNRINITGADVYQANHGLDKLIDGNLESLAELKWDYGPNHVNGQLPEHIRLPQAITLSLNGDQPTRLRSILVNKRTPGNGTVTKYKVETFLKDQLVHASEEISVPFEAAEFVYDIQQPADVDKVVLTILEARTSATAVNNKMMTLREVTLFEVPRPKEAKLEHVDEATKVKIVVSDKEPIAVDHISVTRVEDFDKTENPLQKQDVDVYNIGALTAENRAINTTQPIKVYLPVPTGKQVSAVLFADVENYQLLPFTVTEDGFITFTANKLVEFYVAYERAINGPGVIAPEKPIYPIEDLVPEQPKHDVTYIDEATGIKISFSSGEEVPVEGIMVKPLPQSDEHHEALKGKDYTLYDIEALDASNQHIDLQHGAIVVMPVDPNKQVESVLFISDEGQAQHLPFEQKGATVEFKAAHFSYYAILYKLVVKDNQQPEAPKPNEGNDKPETPQTPKPNDNANVTPPSKDAEDKPKDNTQKDLTTDKQEGAKTEQTGSATSNTEQSQSSEVKLPNTHESSAYAVFSAAALSILASVGLVATRKKEEL